MSTLAPPLVNEPYRKTLVALAIPALAILTGAKLGVSFSCLKYWPQKNYARRPTHLNPYNIMFTNIIWKYGCGIIFLRQYLSHLPIFWLMLVSQSKIHYPPFNRNNPKCNRCDRAVWVIFKNGSYLQFLKKVYYFVIEISNYFVENKYKLCCLGTGSFYTGKGSVRNEAGNNFATCSLRILWSHQ